jgi:hypothetical protein
MISTLGSRAPIGWAAYRRIELVNFVKASLPEKEWPKDLESMTKDFELIPLLNGLVMQGKVKEPKQERAKLPEVAALEAQIAEMQAQMAELVAGSQRRGPGRPPKDD